MRALWDLQPMGAFGAKKLCGGIRATLRLLAKPNQ
jgi:hypothetical protein